MWFDQEPWPEFDGEPWPTFDVRPQLSNLDTWIPDVAAECEQHWLDKCVLFLHELGVKHTDIVDQDTAVDAILKRMTPAQQATLQSATINAVRVHVQPSPERDQWIRSFPFGGSLLLMLKYSSEVKKLLWTRSLKID